jgi:cold-inducible RNA-binding protein
LQISFSNENRGAPEGNQGNQRQFRQGGGGGGGNSANTIFVGNVSYNSSEDSFRKFFSKSGNVQEVRIAKDQGGKHRGFCHVEFDSEESVNKALQLDGAELDGRNLRVNRANDNSKGILI